MNKSILIVDDEPDFLDVIEVALLMGGYRVARAKDGKQAWEMLDSETPGIILSDYSMPRMNGCELFDLVRSSSRGRNMPFIFMSATPELISSVGSYSVLRKPFQFDALMAKVDSMCA
ncbi:response regulator [Herbaspirillum lusitanum]|uniref:response regulator n=1 Tax=Herbaspirillum lusitanum TaxID=213312 RepID=UPI00223836F7|nr:response regulator [Herbaspirillum lusitanum]